MVSGLQASGLAVCHDFMSTMPFVNMLGHYSMHVRVGITV